MSQLIYTTTKYIIQIHVASYAPDLSWTSQHTFNNLNEAVKFFESYDPVDTYPEHDGIRLIEKEETTKELYRKAI